MLLEVDQKGNIRKEWVKESVTKGKKIEGCVKPTDLGNLVASLPGPILQSHIFVGLLPPISISQTVKFKFILKYRVRTFVSVLSFYLKN